MHFKNITEQKIAYKLLTLAAFVTVVLFVVRVIYAGAIALPYPQEIQEASSVALTNMFLEGKSPYLAASIDETIKFVNESSDLEFSIMADYFEDVAYMTQSKEFLEAIRNRFINVTDHSLDLKYICEQINYAEDVFPIEEF